MTADFAAQGYLYVPSGVEATIDLNGHSIDRGLTAASEKGYVIENNGKLTITDSSGNDYGKITGGYGLRGGAVYNTGDLTVSGGTFSGNVAKTDGGGIWNGLSGVLTLTGGTISGNLAYENGSGVFESEDGTLRVSGSPVVRDNIKNNLFLDRNAVITVNGTLDNSAKLNVAGTNLSGRAVTSGLGSNSASAFTFASGGTQAKVNSGGEIVPNVNATVTVNTWAELQEAVKTDNAVIALGQDITSGGSGTNGHIKVDSTTVTIDLCGHTINRNRSSSDTDGHAFWSTGTSVLTVRDTYGGGVIKGGNATNGGAVYVNRDAAAFSATNSLFTDNRSTAHAGGAITAYADTSLDGCTVSGNTAYTTGGGIWSSKSLTLENTVIENNTANGTSDSRGGAVCVISGTANMTDCTVGNNTSKDGGAVYVNDESTAVFNATNTVFIGNESTEHGGGAVTAFAEATFDGCTFTGNKAYKSGGGIWTDTTITMTDCNVNNNIAENNCGGGIYARSVLNLTGCVVSSNTCAEWGGGIYLPDDTGSTLNMTNGRIENNTCGNNGGVQVSGTAEMNISGYIVISNNKKAGEDNNLCLAEGKSVTVAGALDPETRIGVLKSNPAGNITSGLNDKGGADNFSSDDSDYTVAVDGSGEAYLSKTTADYTVNSWASLQSAVNGASYGAVIELSDDVINTNNKERIRVNGDKNITIDLKGKTIDRKRKDKDRDGHVFEVFGRLTVRDSVGGGKITGGFANNGGGVNVGDGGWFILAGGTIYYNKGDNGGGVHVKDGGRLTVTGGTISRNEASEHGGGIYIASGGRVDLSNAAIKMNSAQNDGGGVYLHLGYNATFSNCQITENYSYDYGGGIYMDERGKTLTIKNNTIINNNFSDDDGGGIYLYRGTINMNGGSVSENSTRCDGGGVRVTGDTTFSAENVKIQNNTAQTEDGGGLKNHGTTTLKSCLITGNKSVKEGGGVYNDADSDSAGDLTIDSCVIAGNSTSGGDDKSNGGGVYNHEKLTIKGNTTIGACTVDGVNYPGNHADKHGGGLYASKGKGSQDVKIQGKLLMEGNTAGLGYDLYLAGDKKLELTGRIDNTRIGFVDMADPGVMTVNYNKYHNVEDPANYFATGEGAIPISWTSDGKEARMHSNWNVLQRDINNAESGDTITLGQNYTASSDDDRLKIPKGKTLTIDLKGYTINRNRIKKDRDGHVIEVFGNLTVKDSSKDHSGKITGGFANNGGVNVSEDNAVFTLEGGSICGNNADDGGVYVRGTGYFNMKGGSVSNNTASSQGGGIYVCSGGKLDMSDADVSGNTASNDGGGMYLKIDEDATFTNCTIKDNTSFDYGGGIYMDAGGKTLTINGKNTAIDNNNASDDGGGIHLRNGTINMTGGSVSGNITRYDSGGVKVSSSCTFTADGVTISNNTASNEEGGGIKNLGTTSLTDCTISGNKAKLNGGGIYNDASGDSAGKLTLNNCTITKNNTSDNGGGVYNDESLTIIGGTISSNKADDYGGGVFVNNGEGAKDVKIQGKVIIKENNAGMFADDLYIEKDRVLTVTGALTGSEIHVDMEAGTGILTNDYAKHNSVDLVTVEPANYFFSAKGYEVELKNGEAEISSGWAALKKQIEEYTGTDPIKLTKDYAAKPSDDRIKIPAGKEITIDLNGHTLNRNRATKTSDGHVIEVFGTLLLKDTGTAKTGALTGGSSAHGGGVYIHDKARLTMLGGSVTGNHADTGGGIYINNGGTLEMLDGTVVKDNTSWGSAGGVFVNTSGTFRLYGGSITGNTASENGGGVLANGDYFSVHGRPVVKNNKASKTGGDIYLPSGRTIDIDGILSDGARLGVSIAGDFGTFTNRYSNYNSAYPSRYFVSTQGYTVLLENREAELVTDTFGETDFESPFIGRKDQMNADPDTLSSVNWLSGVSGENYLNEINMPGSYDSSMNKLETVGNPATPSIPLALFFGGNILFPLSLFTLIYADYTSFVPFIAPTIGRKFAKTQIEYIDEQLQGGARQLDLRLNDRYKDGSSGGFHYNDDGENLWVCHGKSGGGTYFAENDNGKRLSLDMILTWCKDFLKNHPTETIILDLRPETEEKDHTNNIYLRARKILEKSLVDDENPTIDEPYLYKEPGSDDYFAQYTHMPQLKDCRGKIVIQPEDPQFMAKIGGYMLDSFSDQYDAYFEGLDFTQQAHEMVEQVKREYTGLNGSGSVKLPTDSDTRCNNLWYWELNCTGQNQGTPKNYTFWGEAPYVMAEDVNPEVAADGKLFGPQKAGQYIGWVRFDSFEAQYAEAVWQTNFSDALQYCTVTVESGLDESIYPAQTFKVLKGTNITIPGNIYKNLSTGKNIGGWTAKGATVDTVCAMGDDFKISEDVTFTAKWLEKGQVPVRIEWKDGENADQLRGGSVKLNVNAEGGTKELTLSANGSWQGIVSVEGDVTGIVPDWNKIVITDENPLGQDIEGQYRYGSMYEAGNGFVLTFTHTPLTKTSVAGMIVWDDEGYENKRPSSVTVHLLKNGADTGTSATVTAENDWQFDFTDLAQYENGEEIKYSITEDDVVGYTAIIDGYTVTNSYVINDNDTLEAIGLIAWDDSDNAGGIRPESVTVHLMNNGEEVASKEVEAGELGIWSFILGKIPINDIENYTLTVDEVDGYTATVDNSASPAFSVTYTLLVEESEKDPAELIEVPAALDLTYTGEAQTLIEEGKASGGWPVYALGTNDTTAPDAAEYNALLPAGIDVGTYYVWYYVKGDALHTDTEPQCLTASIKRKFFTGHSLTLEGDIGVNFFVNLTEEEVQNATVRFTWFDKTLNNVPLNTQLCDNGYYKVSCPVAVAEMTYEITATLKINGEEAATDTCSVVEYANKILSEDYEETYTGTGAKSYTNLKALVQSMLDYGSRAQTRFDRNTENLANGGNYFFDNEVVIDSVASDMSADLENYGLRYEFTSVLFLSKTSLRHYYTVTDKDKFASFSGLVTINGVIAEPVEKYGKIYFEKTNIAASELDLQFALKIGNSTYDYSVIDYVKLFVGSDLEEASIELGKATYRYNQAAKAYFAE